MSTKPLHFAAALILVSLGVSSAHASLVQQGNKIIGAAGTATARQGSAAALSADGNTAIVGGSQDNSGAGAAWVYVRNGKVWSQQGNKLVGTGATGAASQGASVALSADGNTAIVGGLFDNTNVGAVWVYTRTNGVWSQQGTKLVPIGGVGAQYQGVSVALSADGNTAIVGGYFDNSNVGAAWVLTRSGNVWAQQAKLVGTGATGQSYQGISVALSSDGNTAAVGGYGDNANTGATWVFTRSGTVWSQQGTKLVGSGGVGSSIYQGVSVTLSADGNTLAAGGYFDNNSAGAAWVFTRSGGVWTQQGTKLVATDETGAGSFGYNVRLSADGNTLLSTGYQDNSGAGAAWLFTRSAGAWSQSGSKLVGTGAVGAANQGVSSALSSDGQTVLLCGPADNSNAGAAWVFVNPAPKIASITDVPNDQGGKVSVRWTADLQDVAPANPIDVYWIWRQVPSSSALVALQDGATLVRDGASAAAVDGRAFRSTIEAGQTYYWEYVGSQVSHGFPGYSYTAPTLSDSVAGSNPYTLFMVESEQTSTGKYWSSNPDSGYSVDDLAPNTPSSFTGNYASGATHLHWAVNSETDLAGYRLYRGSSAGFVPSEANLVSAQADTGFADPGAPGSYYKVSAVDIHGNESGDALLSPDATTAVGAGPIAFALERMPSPVVGGRFTARFSLPVDARATLEVIDVTGRALVRREVGMLGAGSHAVALGEGRSFGSGIYFVRLVQGAKSATARVVVID